LIKKKPINVVSTHKSTSHSRARQDTTSDIETQKAARSLGKMLQENVENNVNTPTQETRSNGRKNNSIELTKQKHHFYNKNKNNTKSNDEVSEDDDSKDDEDSNDNDSKDEGISHDDNMSKRGYSNGSDDEQNNNNKYYKQNNEKQLRNHVIAMKPHYEDELEEHRWSDTIAMDVQLIKGVLPNLFAVLKFLKSDDDLVYNGTICCYFFKKLQVAESKQYEWWKQNSHAVQKSIDGRCASMSNLIK